MRFTPTKIEVNIQGQARVDYVLPIDDNRVFDELSKQLIQTEIVEYGVEGDDVLVYSRGDVGDPICRVFGKTIPGEYLLVHNGTVCTGKGFWV